MYCKFCACNLGQENITKCPNCGVGIDLNDGGQSFFEDVDLLSWSQAVNSDESSTPKTEIRRVIKQKPPHVFSHSQGNGKQANGGVFNGNADKPVRKISNEFVIKAGILCTTIIMLLVLLILFVNKCCATDTLADINNNVTEPTENTAELYKLGDIVENLSYKTGNDTTEDSPAGDDKSNDETYKSVTLDEISVKDNVSFQFKNNSEIRYFKVDGVTYMSMDEFFNVIGLYNCLYQVSNNANSTTYKVAFLDYSKEHEIKVDEKNSSYTFTINKLDGKPKVSTEKGKFYNNGLHFFDVEVLTEFLGLEYGTDIKIVSDKLKWDPDKLPKLKLKKDVNPTTP